MKHTLLIPLVGPLQSWGSRSRFDDRDTHIEPTKSGVLGLVCAALGRGREESVEDLDALRFGVRVEEPGRLLIDFHTAQGVIRAGGSGTSTVTSRRHYLADAVFLAGLEGEDGEIETLRKIEAALKEPVWPLSLGRKSCPLTVPPYLPCGSLREGMSLKEALEAEKWRPLRLPPRWDERKDEEKLEKLRLVWEDEQGLAVQADRPLSYADRRFGLRRLQSDMVDRPKEEEPWCIYPS
jgi:CRISPR system Cascade subunit CasD